MQMHSQYRTMVIYTRPAFRGNVEDIKGHQRCPSPMARAIAKRSKPVSQAKVSISETSGPYGCKANIDKPAKFFFFSDSATSLEEAESLFYWLWQHPDLLDA